MDPDVMTVHVRYHNILRRRAGVDQETLVVPAGTTAHAVLAQLAGQHGPALHEMLLTPAGDVVSHLVVFRNRQLVGPGQHQLPLVDGDELLLFPAVSGG